MLEFSKVKIAAILAVLLAGLVFAVPNAFPEQTVAAWPSWAPKQRMNLGLDLRGGSHILLEADTKGLARATLDTIEDNALTELRRAPGGRIEIGDVSNRGGRVSFIVRNVDDVDRAVDLLRQLSTPIGVTGQRNFNVEIVDGNRVLLTPTNAGATQAIESAMVQAVEVIPEMPIRNTAPAVAHETGCQGMVAKPVPGTSSSSMPSPGTRACPAMPAAASATNCQTARQMAVSVPQ